MSKQKAKWGVLGVAGIAVKKVIPAMQKGEWSEIAAIASRELSKAEKTAQQLGIPKAYGSYEELLADPEIEAIYNPLPNHLHVPWSIKAAEAGKHVLCEKPLSLTVREAKELLRVRDRCGVKIGEAFMVKTHPQWLRVRDLIGTGVVGRLRSIVGMFSYFNRDPKNVRNVADWGGGGLMDIGCYPITTSRWIFGEEPLLGESGANDLQTVFSGSDHLLKVEHRTSNVQRRIAGYYRRLCVAFDTNALHSPSRGHFLEYELHQFFG